MRRWSWFWVLVLSLGLGLIGWAQAANVGLHGEFGVKVQSTDAWGIIQEDPNNPNNINLVSGLNDNRNYPLSFNRLNNGATADRDSDNWASLQFRLWAVASSDDGKVKGVWAMEVGSVRFGDSEGLSMRNENVNIEVRQMYLDFALPFAENLGLRMRAGLNPYFVNRFLWNENAPGIDISGKTNLGGVDTTFVFVWVRAIDRTFNRSNNENNDFDAFAGVFIFDLAKALNVDKAMTKVYFIPINGDDLRGNHVNPWYLGADAQFGVSGVDVDLGIIHMGGDYVGDADFDSWFYYVDLGYQMSEQTRLGLLFWRASGDNDGGDVENYIAVDTHTEGSVVLFEDGAFDDGFAVSTAPYLNELGFQMYRFRVDYKATPKLSLAAAVNYMKFDEDARNGDDDIGWELDFYAKYELYKDFTVDLAAGYLWAGDALDAWANGDADDMYRISLGATYTF